MSHDVDRAASIIGAIFIIIAIGLFLFGVVLIWWAARTGFFG